MAGISEKKNGVKNSLVNNINARKKQGKSRSKERSTVSKEAYSDMKDNWAKKRPRKVAKKK